VEGGEEELIIMGVGEGDIFVVKLDIVDASIFGQGERG
jgi:hypothetical protein